MSHRQAFTDYTSKVTPLPLTTHSISLTLLYFPPQCLCHRTHGICICLLFLSPHQNGSLMTPGTLLILSAALSLHTGTCPLHTLLELNTDRMSQVDAPLPRRDVPWRTSLSSSLFVLHGMPFLPLLVPG